MLPVGQVGLSKHQGYPIWTQNSRTPYKDPRMGPPIYGNSQVSQVGPRFGQRTIPLACVPGLHVPQDDKAQALAGEAASPELWAL